MSRICCPAREIPVPHTSAGPATKAGLPALTVARITKRTGCTAEQGRTVVALAEAHVTSCVMAAYTSAVFSRTSHGPMAPESVMVRPSGLKVACGVLMQRR